VLDRLLSGYDGPKAEEIYRQRRGRLFGSYEDGKRYFDEVFEYFDRKKGLYIGQGVDLKKLAEESAVLGDGAVGREPVYVPPGDSFGHTTILGTTRRGKTRFMLALVRQMIWFDEDVFIVEPKGSIGQEVIAWVVEFLEEVGKLESFKYISPVFPEYSIKYNTFFGMDDEGLSSGVQNMILVDERFFADIGYEVTMSICLGTRFLETLWSKEDVENKILEEYRRVFGKRKIVDPVNMLAEPGLLDALVEPQNEGTIEEMDPPLRTLLTVGDVARYANKRGIVALLDRVNSVTEEQIRAKMAINYPNSQEAERKTVEALHLRAEAVKALESQADKPQDYFSKVSSSYKLVLDKLSSGKLGKLLNTTRINPLYDILKQGDAARVFVMQPAPLLFKEAAVSLMRLTTSMFMNWYGRVGMSGRAFPRPFNYVVDEAGAILTPEVIELLNKGGGLRMKMTLATQSFFDYVDALGPEKASVAFDNMNVKCYFAVNDDESKRKISDSFSSIKRPSSTFGSSGIDMRAQVNRTAEEILLPGHISELPRRTFLYQNAETKMLVEAPFLDDPTHFIEMPYLEMEEDINRYYGMTMKEVREWERGLADKTKKEIEKERIHA